MTSNRVLITEIVFQNYITHVVLSRKRRAKHYKLGDKIPLKYSNLKFNADKILVDERGIPIVANTKAVGTPKVKRINGQDFYKGWGHPAMRNIVVDAMKDHFLISLMAQLSNKTIHKIPLDKFPVQLEMDLHCDVGIGNWDLDNLWIYNKVIQDCLTDTGIIPEDNVKYITKPGALQLIPISAEEPRKIVVRIYQDLREVILTNNFYKNGAAGI